VSDVDPAPTVWTSTRLTALAGCSAVQLVTGTLALRYAVERGLAVDIAGIRRRGADVPRDSWFLGTGITAPIAMMAVQAVATGRVLRYANRAAARTLGVLGAVMVVGYVGERETRSALTPGRWDRRVSPLTGAGLALAVLMAALGLSRFPPDRYR
jgi:hypothetical protein